jgi:hypothetical protein
MNVVAKYLGEIAHATPGRGSLCLACDTEFSTRAERPRDFVVVVPSMVKFGELRNAMATGVCTRCSQRSDEDLVRIGLESMRKIWPGLHVPQRGTA